MEQLAGQMGMAKGKKPYGYLPNSGKKTVDEVVDKLEELPVVRACCHQWCRLQGEVENYSHDKPRERKKLSQEKTFRQIKNTVIQEAERVRMGEISFEDNASTGHNEPEQARGDLRLPPVMLTVTQLLYYMSRIFEDHALPRSGTGLHIDRKSRQKFMEKRVALGHKSDDYEEKQNADGMTKGGMRWPLPNLRRMKQRERAPRGPLLLHG